MIDPWVVQLLIVGIAALFAGFLLGALWGRSATDDPLDSHARDALEERGHLPAPSAERRHVLPPARRDRRSHPS